MTQWNKTTVSCPACLTENSFSICTLLDVRDTPDLKEGIFDRSIFRFTCPECGEEILVSYNCTYIDKDNGFAVVLISDTSPVADITASDCTLRITRSINEFVEKIALSEDGIDDRIIELYKIMLEDQFEEERHDSELLGIYYAGQAADTKALLFYIITGNAENSRAELSFDVYNAISLQFEETVKFDCGCSEINRAWALNVLQKQFPENTAKQN